MTFTNNIALLVVFLFLPLPALAQNWSAGDLDPKPGSNMDDLVSGANADAHHTHAGVGANVDPDDLVGDTVDDNLIDDVIIHSSIARDSELAAKSAASSTDNAVPKFDSTAGDVQDSGVLVDDSNNLTVPGDLTVGTSGATCLILRDSDNDGDSACSVLNGTFTCETDINGICDDAI